MQTDNQFPETSHDPGQVQKMTAAYDLALSLLGLQYRDDPVTRIIATKVIEVFGRGADDPQDVCNQVLSELGVLPRPV